MKKNQIKTISSESKMTINRQYDHKFKFMMLGDAGVGKTSIARRFVDEAFLHTYIHTIGIDFLEKVVDLEGKKVLLQIWDTAGQDRFRTLIRPYYRGAAGMIMVYDVTDEKTFDSIEEWMRCIAENTQECQIIQKVILANKTTCPIIELRLKTAGNWPPSTEWTFLKALPKKATASQRPFYN